MTVFGVHCIVDALKRRGEKKTLKKSIASVLEEAVLLKESFLLEAEDESSSFIRSLLHKIIEDLPTMDQIAEFDLRIASANFTL